MSRSPLCPQPPGQQRRGAQMPVGRIQEGLATFGPSWKTQKSGARDAGSVGWLWSGRGSPLVISLTWSGQRKWPPSALSSCMLFVPLKPDCLLSRFVTGTHTYCMTSELFSFTILATYYGPDAPLGTGVRGECSRVPTPRMLQLSTRSAPEGSPPAAHLRRGVCFLCAGPTRQSHTEGLAKPRSRGPTSRSSIH